MNKKTTIQIDSDLRELLKKNRQYRRETYDDIIKRLVKKDLEKIGAK
jgi:predicted CopG family antitoxin